MSPANVYRFFPSKDAIKESVCMRVMDEVAAIAVVAARTRAPALEKLARLATAVHRHNKTRLVHERRMHDMVVAAMLASRPLGPTNVRFGSILLKNAELVVLLGG
jgi:AcrR family transcriptional regulator